MILYDLTKNWKTINDTVMGGKSQSKMVKNDDGFLFTGTVSTDNFGGFCSVHGPTLNKDLSEYEAFRFEAKGDGKDYRFLAYTTDRTASYRTDVDVPTQWKTITVPFDDLYPYKWGWKNWFAKRFDPSNFETVGFQVGYKQKGNFELEIKNIEVI